MNRLKEETSVFDIDYTYDSMGNRTQEVEGAVTTNYTYSNMMRLLSKTEGGVSTSFGYDRNGNLTSKTEGNSSYTYVWDYDNRLKEVRQNGNVLFSYAYDPNGRRVRSLNSGTGVTTTYIYAGINVIYEKTPTESTDYLYANGMRIAKKTGATVKYFHSDHLGSTRLVTDSSGQPTFESDYKPFGEDANATGTEKYAFTGQYSEAEIGLYYFGARWYDASLGRFISEDPIKGSMTSSQSQNPYVYCMNNPLRYVDPSGMACQHEYRDGREVDLYENGKIVVNAETGEIIRGDIQDLSPKQISQMIREGTSYIWQQIEEGLYNWYGAFGFVETTTEYIKTNGIGVDPSVRDGTKYSWKDIGFSKPAFTPREFFKEVAKLDRDFGIFTVASTIVTQGGAQVAGIAGQAILRDIFLMADLSNNLASIQSYDEVIRRGNLMFDLIRIQYGPNTAYGGGQTIILSDGTRAPYDPYWGN